MADRKHSPAVAALWSSRLLLTVMVGAGLVIAAFLTVLSGSWWLLAGAVVVLLAVTSFVVRNVLSLLGDVDAPSPTERARLEAHGRNHAVADRQPPTPASSPNPAVPD
jgi:membrane protein implicated in regulation of membrane protease activity